MLRSTKKIAIKSVTAGKPCRISVSERNVLRPTKFMRDSAYPAIDDTSSTIAIIDTAITAVLSVIVQMLGLEPVGARVRNSQLRNVHPPKLPSALTGIIPSVRNENVATNSHT